MKRVALCLTLLALCAHPLAAQDRTFEVTTTEGTFTMTMTIVEGTGEKVALAAGEKGPEPEGVMVRPVPGGDHLLRTEHFEDQGDVTRMIPADKNASSMVFADTVCTSRWNTRMTGSHTLVSNIEKGESEMEWATRHRTGYMVISSIHAPTGKLSERDPPRSPARRSVVSTAWTDADDVEHEMATRQRSHEDKSDWLARHRLLVEAFAEALQPKA